MLSFSIAAILDHLLNLYKAFYMHRAIGKVMITVVAVMAASSCKKHTNTATIVTPVTSVVVPPVVPLGFSAYIDNTLWIPTFDSAAFRFSNIGKYGDSLYDLLLHASDSSGTKKRRLGEDTKKLFIWVLCNFA